jgi:hypothetical protein
VRRLDEISQGPRGDPRLPSGRWLVGVAAVALIAVITTLVLSEGGRRHAVSPPGGPKAFAAPGPSSTAAPGTLLLTCDSAVLGQLGPDWRAGSLRAGPLWFVDGRQLGYVHYGGWPGADRAMRRQGKFRFVVMIVEVATGSTVVMKPAATARSYFRFVDGFGPGSGYQLPTGDTGFTFAACPRGTSVPNGRVTDFYLGYSIKTGRAALVEVRSSAMPHPIQVIFTCPVRGCGTTG